MKLITSITIVTIRPAMMKMWPSTAMNASSPYWRTLRVEGGSVVQNTAVSREIPLIYIRLYSMAIVNTE